MRLTEIGLTHFRNLVSEPIEIPPEGAVLVGANGQGKTNFLEAIHFLVLFRSFRGVRHSDAIAFDADHFRVEGKVAYEGGRSRSVAVAADHGARRITLDGLEAARVADAIGTVVAVLVSPEDLTLVTGAPRARRRYLDAVLALASRRLWNALQDYERALRQRNGLLRAPLRAAPGALEPWDQALVTAGTPIVVERAALVRRMAKRFAVVAGGLACSDERTSYGLGYRPSVPVDPGEAEDPVRVASAWHAALAAGRERDRQRGWTGIGPHRDEVAVELTGRPVARFGSQGERRTAAIVLRLLEAEVLEAETGHRPILLLDDVFSELDPGRAERLLDWLGDRHQRFVTSPRPLAGLDGSLVRWQVDRGRIERPAA
ncbi:MAG: DNA replication and repair protein RecF [Pseudomonadota bacterium]|nr:DNA replication and repair protein RecF [Pseudomonadota bacterium]